VGSKRNERADAAASQLPQSLDGPLVAATAADRVVGRGRALDTDLDEAGTQLAQVKIAKLNSRRCCRSVSRSGTKSGRTNGSPPVSVMCPPVVRSGARERQKRSSSRNWTSTSSNPSNGSSSALASS
jgi:hypothetical protein